VPFCMQWQTSTVSAGIMLAARCMPCKQLVHGQRACSCYVCGFYRSVLCRCWANSISNLGFCAVQRDLLLLADSVLRGTTVELTPAVSTGRLQPRMQCQLTSADNAAAPLPVYMQTAM
jgi:hypothetical protein